MIDFQGLLNVLHAAEREQNFCMARWKCGTTHCMIGAFINQNPNDSLELYVEKSLFEDIFAIRLKSPECESLPFTETRAIAERFGISEHEARWLFTHNPLRWNVVAYFQGDCGDFFPYTPVRPTPDAARLTKEEALARLRKFIYYKLHKQEMEYETGRNRQLIQPKNISGRNSAVVAGVINA